MARTGSFMSTMTLRAMYFCLWVSAWVYRSLYTSTASSAKTGKEEARRNMAKPAHIARLIGISPMRLLKGDLFFSKGVFIGVIFLHLAGRVFNSLLLGN